jgi:hypothetical protein
MKWFPELPDRWRSKLGQLDVTLLVEATIYECERRSLYAAIGV